MELNFVFCDNCCTMVPLYRKKRKVPKSVLDSMSKTLLQSLRQHDVLPPPFTQRRLNKA